MTGKVDEQLDIEDTERISQELADKFGIVVTIDVTDEDDAEMEPYHFEPHCDEIEF